VITNRFIKVEFTDKNVMKALRSIRRTQQLLLSVFAKLRAPLKADIKLFNSIQKGPRGGDWPDHASSTKKRLARTGAGTLIRRGARPSARIQVGGKRRRVRAAGPVREFHGGGVRLLQSLPSLTTVTRVGASVGAQSKVREWGGVHNEGGMAGGSWIPQREFVAFSERFLKSAVYRFEKEFLAAWDRA
jgi:phage gpG-like protein